MPSLLVRECLRIEEAIEVHCASGPGLHMKRVPLRRELLRMLVIRDERPPGLLDLPSRPPRLTGRLGDRVWRLSCAIYLWQKHRLSKGRAARLAAVPESELDYVAFLAETTQESLVQLAEQVDAQVLAEVDGFFEQLTVMLDQRAVEDLLLAAAETYAVKDHGKGKKYTEAYGLCFGTHKEERNGTPEFTRLFNVTRIVTQIRARGGASQVTPNDHSARVHRQVAEKFFRHLELVGDYHTHPFPDLAALRERRGWEYSPADESSAGYWVDDCRKEGSDPRFSLILAIARGGKPGRHASRLAPNRIQLTVDDYFFILAAYRIRRDGSYDKQITLDCPQVNDA